MVGATGALTSGKAIPAYPVFTRLLISDNTEFSDFPPYDHALTASYDGKQDTGTGLTEPGVQ